MKGKLVTMAVSFLLCVGMVGAGFASWVITNTQTSEVDGEIQVEQVIDKRLKAEINTDGVDVAFGAPAQMSNDGWLQNDTYVYDENGSIIEDKSAPVEDLNSTITIAMVSDNLSQLYHQGMESVTWTVTMVIKASDNAVFNAAIGNNLISLPQAETLDDGATITVGKTNDEAKNILITYTKVIDLQEYETSAGANANLTVDFEFAWGTAFQGKNPYEFFNAEDIDPNEADGMPLDGEVVVEGVTYTISNWGDYAYYALNVIERMGTISTTITVTGVANTPTLDV